MCAHRAGKGSADQGSVDERGQTTLEFALVIVFLLLMLFGIIDFSRLFFAYATMSNGVREGARYAIIHPGNDTAIEERARNMMVLVGANATVQIDYPDVDSRGDIYCSRNCRVVVTATSNLNVWTPVIPNVQIVARSTMHIE